MGPGRVTANNIEMALDKPLSARVLLMNEKRLSRMARVERGFLNSIPQPSSEQVLRRFILDTEKRPLSREFRMTFPAHLV